MRLVAYLLARSSVFGSLAALRLSTWDEAEHGVESVGEQDEPAQRNSVQLTALDPRNHRLVEAGSPLELHLRHPMLPARRDHLAPKGHDTSIDVVALRPAMPEDPGGRHGAMKPDGAYRSLIGG
jgi:hypothetical protein